jgi:hypothetical protein
MLYYSIQKLNESIIEELSEEEKFKTKKLMKEIKQNNFLSNINLNDIFENSDFDFKEIELVRSLGTTFYKCPNGHFYAIGECGRPMEEGKCPDCGFIIGGRDHRSASQNTRFDLNIRTLHNRNNILNQDEEAYKNLIGNNNHQMDIEAEEAIRNNPEMDNYY